MSRILDSLLSTFPISPFPLISFPQSSSLPAASPATKSPKSEELLMGLESQYVDSLKWNAKARTHKGLQ